MSLSLVRPSSLGALVLALLWAAAPFACARAVTAPPGGIGGSAPKVETVCAGVAASCEARGAFTCTAALGCSTSGRCTGTPLDCWSIFDTFACKQQGGCSAPDFGSCSGTATPCNFYDNKTPCQTQQGCTWETTCDGTPTACKDLPLDACATQPGCFLAAGGAPCADAADCSPEDDACNTGECLDGVCLQAADCVHCTAQADCADLGDPCYTGDCVNAACSKKPGCHACIVQTDCTPTVDACNTGNCVNGICQVRTECTSGDACCPAGCAGFDGDCH